MRSCLVLVLVLSGCDQSPSSLGEYNENLKSAYQSMPPGQSPAYAPMKESTAGPNWLATIHGYPDNLGVCEELIEPYNNDPDLSVIQGRCYCERV